MQAKKSLGQNFLTSSDAVADIVRAGKVSHEDVVLEIGPGTGVLTETLLQHARRVIAVEKDDRMIPILEAKFAAAIASGTFVVHHGDILTMDIGALVGDEPYKLIANIPYYITGEIMRMFFETTRQPTCIVVMVQKEVAERIVARDEKESILSISVKVYGEPTYVRTVPREFFEPAPNVDSAILLVEKISKKNFGEFGVGEERFFEILKAGFAHKRKLVARNLESVAPREKVKKAFENMAILGISETARAEELTARAWLTLTQHL